MVETRKPESPDTKLQPRMVERHTVIDDFIRNFLIKYKMKRTLDAFQVKKKTKGIFELSF